MTMHLLRPEWCWAYLPWLVLSVFMIRRRAPDLALLSICDANLIPYLVHKTNHYTVRLSVLSVIISAGLMVFSLSGPAWSRCSAPAIQIAHPRIILLHLSSSMLARDISPDRLSRAKLNIHQLLRSDGPWGLIVYTEEPFVLSPLTQDGQLMDEWVDTLSPSVMPIAGNRLERALTSAARLMSDSGFEMGDVLVLTDIAPNQADISTARALSGTGLHISIMPVIASTDNKDKFLRFAQHGGGMVVDCRGTHTSLNNWLNHSQSSAAKPVNSRVQLPIWQDQGRWFLIPAFLLILPLFQRGAKHRLLS